MKNQHGKSPVKTVVRKWQAGRIAGFEINPRIADRLSCGFQIDVGKIDADDAFYVGGLQHDAREASGSAPDVKNALGVGDTCKFNKPKGELAAPAPHEML
jgi:hypothetical protein